ncbi:hypothetical protein GGTG_07597 [Gaeumannomyces tritici R3-111a-1]|uniref:Nucleoside phosphorylase domain-containing protein n=1 Tax=Gaeumannomyces tritici (strain R3-111a-1) TaxID=644352 RepID=J3P249_GAET3|nr:hypothetical protein GGTG_07597 [Gaeumannomyces tritici R3-111a-1]EJT73741.1 hypothetical protein GGTG_07597 [Gaeumannomyces tritici R3-111a-1]
MAAQDRKRLTVQDYHVAWICAVRDIELLPARLMLDVDHLAPGYDTEYNEYTYLFGEINRHNVVLATLLDSKKGNVNSGHLASQLFRTFPAIRITLLVGIGGGIPSSPPHANPLQDIHLGDVVVGYPLSGNPPSIYYAYGRFKPGGREVLDKGRMEYPDRRALSGLDVLISDYEFDPEEVRARLSEQLKRLRDNKRHGHKFRLPPPDSDKLFKSDNHHQGDWGDCDKCHGLELVKRPPRQDEDRETLVFHRGMVAIGDQVIRDGEERERIRELCDGFARCVDMVAAGVEINRKCLIIRGISNYADSHKNDEWKQCAAGHAAAFARQLLCTIPAGELRAKEESEKIGRSHEVTAPFIVPYCQNPDFIGRSDILKELAAKLGHAGKAPEKNHAHLRACIHGLGGVGKTQIAVAYLFQLRAALPDVGIFWAHDGTAERFRKSYLDIAQQCKISRRDGPEDSGNALSLVKDWLASEKAGRWLMVVDNADDAQVLFPSTPQISRRSRSDLVACPWPLVQAAAYMNAQTSSVRQYIAILDESDDSLVDILSKEFEAIDRESETPRAVMKTWILTFRQIQKQNPFASKLLSLMSFFDRQAIPRQLLSIRSNHEGKQQQNLDRKAGSRSRRAAKAFMALRSVFASRTSPVQLKASLEAEHSEGDRHGRTTQPLVAVESALEPSLSVLKAFSLVSENNDGTVDMHRLVQLATRMWLENEGIASEFATHALVVASQSYPDGMQFENKDECLCLAPHASAVLKPQIQETEESGTARALLLYNIAGLRLQEYRGEIAQSFLEESLQIRERLWGKEHLETMKVMQRLGMAYHLQDKLSKAAELWKDLLIAAEVLLGRDNSFTVETMGNLSETKRSQGRLVEAKALGNEALKRAKKLFGEDHELTLIAKKRLSRDALAGRGTHYRTPVDAGGCPPEPVPEAPDEDEDALAYYSDPESDSECASTMAGKRDTLGTPAKQKAISIAPTGSRSGGKRAAYEETPLASANKRQRLQAAINNVVAETQGDDEEEEVAMVISRLKTDINFRKAAGLELVSHACPSAHSPNMLGASAITPITLNDQSAKEADPAVKLLFLAPTKEAHKQSAIQVRPENPHNLGITPVQIFRAKA